ncbi:class I SAM-dependent methyltransferase [Streptomyces sp. NPDC006638]|uniref:class I SAM-dependent methyltransferase n=1 Tax=Streptomyces sp. NPDC006638 TaxID=3157183 RepID=UPI0033A720BA
MAPFDQAALVYEEFSAGPFRQHLEFPSVLGLLGDMSQLRVLDMGCGNGVYSRMLARAGAGHVLGTDASRGMIEHARDREAKDRLGINYLTGSLPPALAGTFDLVLGVYVLPYATTHDELTALCRSAADALRPGGRFVTLPVHPEVAYDADHYARYGFRLHLDPPLTDGSPLELELSPGGGHELRVTARYWSAAALEKALADAGFGPVRWQSHRLAPAAAARPAEFWAPYLSAPHAAILDTRKESTGP